MVEHPLIGPVDDLTLEELSARVSELQRKLGIATRTGNAHLCHQIRMALETFQNQYRTKLEASYKSAAGNQDFSDRINIE